jgi:hypothetical protein
MLEGELRAVERVFARHPKSYLVCESCHMHEAAVRAIWATPIYQLSGGQIEWIVAQTGHFDHDAMGYYWPAVLAHLVREPVSGAWWECLFARLYHARPRFAAAERLAIEDVLIALVAEPAVPPDEQALVAAFLAFWLENTADVLQVVTRHIQQTWRELLADLVDPGHLGDVERFWYLAQLRQVPGGLRAVSLERCLFLEEVLSNPRRGAALPAASRAHATFSSQ